MRSDRIERGSEIINTLMEGGESSLMKGLGNIAPDLAKYVLEFIFGDLYHRSGLDLKTKQILTITTLSTLGNAKPQLAYHVNAALNIGITREEIINVMTHISGYAGFPASINAIATAKEVFAENDKKNSENKK